MNLELTEDQEFFRETTRKFLESESPLTAVRDLYESPSGFDPSWWLKAAELGWTAMFVPEALGGGSISGQAVADAAIVAEEMGRLVAPGPLVPVNVVASAIARCGTTQQQQHLLPGLLRGDNVATWALCEPTGIWEPKDVRSTARLDGDSLVLDGRKAYVEAASTAQYFLVTARGDDGLTQVIVPRDMPGITITPGRSVDATRRFGSLTFDSVRIQLSHLIGEPGLADETVEQQLALALALQCAEMVGLADRTLEFTLAYGHDRFAFGRPIVSFQSLKHRIADMTVRLEGSRAVTETLASGLDRGDPEVRTLACVAKAFVADSCLDIVDDCVQITGGIGVTWEHDIHLYNRRAVVDRALYGSPEEQKMRLIRLLLEEMADDGC